MGLPVDGREKSRLVVHFLEQSRADFAQTIRYMYERQFRSEAAVKPHAPGFEEIPPSFMQPTRVENSL
jgi:hypothetical protein